VIGELFVSGSGLARGYLNKPELTNERFIKTHLNNDLTYRTGDLVRWNSNGELEYIGRKDNQVKIRGHRIELGEIETVIGKLPEIKKTAVIVSNHLGNEAKLVAYMQSTGLKDSNIIRNQLKEILPD